MTVVVRPGRESDRPGLALMLRAADLSPNLADRDHYERFVALDEDGTVVGFLDGLFDLPVPERAAATTPTGPQAWGNWMAVSPAARGLGVGRALIRAFVLEAQARGCSYFAGMVSEHDDPAGRMAFFRRCGLRDLVPDRPNDIVGASIADILAATAPERRADPDPAASPAGGPRD